MLIKLNNIIGNVIQYSVGDKFIYITDKKLICENTIKEYANLEYFIISKQKLLLFDDGYHYVLNYQCNLIRKINRKSTDDFIEKVMDDDTYLIQEASDEFVIVSCKSLLNDEVKWTRIVESFELYDDVLLVNDSRFPSRIVKAGIRDGVDIWAITLPANDQQKGRIIHYHNLLILPTKASRLYALDKDSGAVVWMVEHTLRSWSVDEANHRLVGVAINNIHLIDVLTGAKTVIPLDQNFMKKEQLELLPHLGTYREGIYYFTSNNYGEIKVGALDISTQQFLALQLVNKENDSSYTAACPKVTSDKLYVRDNHRTLHIFNIIK